MHREVRAFAVSFGVLGVVVTGLAIARAIQQSRETREQAAVDEQAVPEANRVDEPARIDALEAGGSGSATDDRPKHWWCWAGRCERDIVLCRASLAETAMAFINRARSGDRKIAQQVASQECLAAPVAYCAYGECFGVMEMCRRGALAPDHCREVE